MLTLKNTAVKEKITLRNLPTLRQTFVVAGALILIGYVLGYFVHELFMVLPLVVAAGLLFSGVVGFCPMAYLLQKMPWNKE